MKLNALEIVKELKYLLDMNIGFKNYFKKYGFMTREDYEFIIVECLNKRKEWETKHFKKQIEGD